MPRTAYVTTPQQQRVADLRAALAQLQRELVQIVQERQHLDIALRRVASRLDELNRTEQLARRQEAEISRAIAAAERGQSVGVPSIVRYPRLGAIRVQERTIF